MEFKTIYQITKTEPHCTQQVIQDIYHVDDDLFQIPSYSSYVLMFSITIPLLLAGIPATIVHWWRIMSGKGRMKASEEVKLLAILAPISYVLVIGGVFYYVFYPEHIKLADKLAKGEFTQVEGTIYDAEISRGGRYNTTTSRFKIKGKTVNVYSADMGFDNPSHPAIGNGQYVRIKTALSDMANDQRIVSFEVREPILKTCERKTVPW